MNRFLVVLAVALCCGANAQAQQMFKCLDAEGKITYASRKCSDMGLRSGGEITGRINVTPADKPPPRRPPAAHTNAASPAASPVAEPESIKDRDTRCMQVKTAKGVTRRCNETPTEAAK